MTIFAEYGLIEVYLCAENGRRGIENELSCRIG